MARKLLLIDYENIQAFDLLSLADDVDVMLFVGAGQKIRATLSAAMAEMGRRVSFLKMGGTGHNALDFHIACYLGRALESGDGRACYVLSKDKGFDPLLRHLRTLGLLCDRIDNLRRLAAKPPPSGGPTRKIISVATPKGAPASGPKRTPLLKKTKVSTVPKQPAAKQDKAQPSPPDDGNYKKIVDVLAKTSVRGRPRRRARLAKLIAATIPKPSTKQQVEAIIERLVTSKQLSFQGDAVSYR